MVEVEVIVQRGCKKYYQIVWCLNFFGRIDKSSNQRFENMRHNLALNSSYSAATYACVKVRGITTLRYRVR
jgi:hypothetical protein